MNRSLPQPFQNVLCANMPRLHQSPISTLSRIILDPDFISSAHLPRLLDPVRHQEGASPRCHGGHLFHLIFSTFLFFLFFIHFLSGGHGACRPQWRCLHPHRLHSPRQQRLPRLQLLLQDLPARRALWGERVCSQLIIKILFSGLARARSPPSYSLAGE